MWAEFQRSTGWVHLRTGVMQSDMLLCQEVIYIPLRGDEYANPKVVDMEVLTVQDEWCRSLL